MNQRFPSQQPPSAHIKERTPRQIASQIVTAAVCLTIMLWFIAVMILS